MSYQVAIDGPAGAGKSTIARQVAKNKGFIYVDTGAMYRAMALHMIRSNVDIKDAEAIAKASETADISIQYVNGEQIVLLNGENVNGLIRTPQVSAMASVSSANPQVRADAGKAAIMRGPLVYCLEECDNGSNLPWIFPDTDAPLGEERSELFGGCVVIKGKGKRGVESSWKGGLYGLRKPELEDVEFTAVPYPYWNNRGEGEMIVWMRAL